MTRALLNTQISGGPSQFVKTIFELGTGHDLFTDRSLKGSDTAKKLRDALFPLWDQTAARVDDTKTRNRQDLVKLLAGITYTQRNSDDAQFSLMYAYSRELGNTLARMKDQGIDVPTVQDIRDAGLLRAAPPGARKVSASPEAKKAAARAKLGYATK